VVVADGTRLLAGGDGVGSPVSTFVPANAGGSEVRVSCVPLSGGGKGLAVAPGPGAPPRVLVFKPSDVFGSVDPSATAEDFMALDGATTGGVYVG
jgi:hypothetical protein